MYLKQLIIGKKTVFNVDDLQQIWQIGNKDYLKTLINRMVKRNELLRLKPGIYVLNKNYNIFELANKIKKPSYVSLETVLQKKGVIFQDYSQSIYAISNNTAQFKIDNINFNYCKLSDNILFNPLGIENQETFSMATLERAIADRIYLSPGYFFDNLRDVDLKKLKKISKIYNKRTEKEINKIIKLIQTQNV